MKKREAENAFLDGGDLFAGKTVKKIINFGQKLVGFLVSFDSALREICLTFNK